MKKAKIKSPYKASLLIWGKKFEAQGATISDAIQAIQPGNVKGKSVLVLEYDGKRKERILNPMQSMRLFNSYNLTKEVALKNAVLMFSGFEK